MDFLKYNIIPKNKSMFEKFKLWSKKEQPSEKEVTSEELPEQGQLMKIFSDFKNSPEIFNLVTKQIYEQSSDQFASQDDVKKTLSDIGTEENQIGPLSAAKLIESTLGEGTLRKLAFISESTDAPKNLLKILKKDFEKLTFEKRAEKGLYLFVKETYGISWSLEKTARDAWQNFFDANRGTIDGVNFEAKEKKLDGEEAWRVKLSGEKGYDWRRLVHVGASEEKSPEAVGGFGEGTKYLALVMLRDYGAKEVKYSGNDWALNFYLDKLPRGSYEREGEKGMWVKKKRKEPAEGNSLEILFGGQGAKEKIKTISKARELFYSSENSDFKDASFNNKETGGFKILSPIEKGEHYKYTENQKGHFYHLGQRTHYDSRDSWETVRNINIWAWQRVLPPDRDRGMITKQEMEEKVIPLIVNSMKPEEMEKSVYDFKPLWDKQSFYEEGYKVLQSIAKRLAEAGVKLKFEEEYLANDRMPYWISDLLKEQEYKICPGFMADIGMKRVSERFKELQNHLKVEATSDETKKIELLRSAAKEIGLSENEIKEVWLFSKADEKSIFEGQYNSMFYWISRETLNNDFQRVFDTYLHEAAHKEGPDGNPKFTYQLDHLNSMCREFIKNNLGKFEEFEKEWKSLSEKK